MPACQGISEPYCDRGQNPTRLPLFFFFFFYLFFCWAALGSCSAVTLLWDVELCLTQTIAVSCSSLYLDSWGWISFKHFSYPVFTWSLLSLFSFSCWPLTPDSCALFSCLCYRSSVLTGLCSSLLLNFWLLCFQDRGSGFVSCLVTVLLIIHSIFSVRVIII